MLESPKFAHICIFLSLLSYLKHIIDVVFAHRVHTNNFYCFTENGFDCGENTELFPIREMVTKLFVCVCVRLYSNKNLLYCNVFSCIALYSVVCVCIQVLDGPLRN